jgi:hypothetical protein
MNRIPTIILAYVIALAVAAGLTAAGTLMSEADMGFVERVQFFGGAFLNTGIGPALALGLSLAGIAFGEMKGIRNVLYYVIGGLVVGFVTSWNVDLSPVLENTTDIAPITLAKTMATVASGIGGLVYWFIAMRRAGPAS